MAETGSDERARAARSKEPSEEPISLARVVCALCMPDQLPSIEVHRTQVAGRIPFSLIVEVLRLRVAAFTAGRDRASANAVLAELDDRNEAVPARAVHLLRARV